MVRFLVDRPVAVLVSFFALLLLGVTAYLRLPVALLPDSDVPAVSVRVDAPTFAAQEVEQRIVEPLRASLQQLQGLSDIESVSSEGTGIVHLRFNYGTDMSMAFIEANEKVDLTMDRLPRDVQRPTVSKSGIADIPVFRLNITPKGGAATPGRMAELSSFVREIVRRRIEQLPEVAMVDITGLMQPQVEIIPKRGYLESLGLNDQVLLDAFNENRTDLGNILVRDGHYRYFLRFVAGEQDLGALGNTPLRINGRLFRLSDLATVTSTSAEPVGAYYRKAEQAINIAVIMQSSARMDDLNTSFDVLLEQMRGDYPEIVFERTQDQLELLDYAISNLQQDLILGGVLAFVLMLVFIRKIRMAVLIGVTVPLSLLVSQLGFHLLGISLNVISLGGLILGLSMIIDNSIVVMDAISGHRDRGLSVADAAVAGANEVIRPLITSVLTNCAVFVPLIFLSGLAGTLFYDQAISIVVGVVSSLLVAIVLLPPLYRLVHARQQPRKRSGIPTLINITGMYERGLYWSLRRPVVVSTLVGLLVVGGVLLFRSMEKTRLPAITRHDLEVAIDWNEPLTMDEGEKRITDLARTFGAMATDINGWVGRQQYLLPLIEDQDHNQSRLYMRVADATTLQPLADSVLRYIGDAHPLATVEFFPAKNAFDQVFSDNLPPIRVKVSNATQREMPPLDTLRRVVEELEAALPDVHINPVPVYQKVVLTTDVWQAARYGVSPDVVTDRVEAAFRPSQVGQAAGANAYVPIVLVHPQPESVRQLLATTYVTGAQQQSVPLSALVAVGQEEAYKSLTAGAQGGYYPIDIPSDRPEADLAVVQQVLASHSEVLESDIDGAYFNNQQLVAEMALVFAVSLLLLYFILAAQFESLVQPLFILAELPVALCGALLVLYLGGSGINLMSMIGMVVMGGLVINDSILKIDAINRLRREGMPLVEAIHEGGHRRLHSIVMISLTSIGALCPTLFMDDLGSELQKPLALALIGGMTIGLFVSLFFLPIVYRAVYHRKEKS